MKQGETYSKEWRRVFNLITQIQYGSINDLLVVEGVPILDEVSNTIYKVKVFDSNSSPANRLKEEWANQLVKRVHEIWAAGQHRDTRVSINIQDGKPLMVETRGFGLRL